MAADTLGGSFYLIAALNRRLRYSSRALSFRVTKGAPTLKRDEVAIKVNVSLPEALFNRPSLSATIKVDPEDAPKKVIETVVLDNIKATLRKELDIDMEISVVENE